MGIGVVEHLDTALRDNAAVVCLDIKNFQQIVSLWSSYIRRKFDCRKSIVVSPSYPHHQIRLSLSLGTEASHGLLLFGSHDSIYCDDKALQFDSSERKKKKRKKCSCGWELRASIKMWSKRGGSLAALKSEGGTAVQTIIPPDPPTSSHQHLSPTPTVRQVFYAAVGARIHREIKASQDMLRDDLL